MVYIKILYRVAQEKLDKRVLAYTVVDAKKRSETSILFLRGSFFPTCSIVTSTIEQWGKLPLKCK